MPKISKLMTSKFNMARNLKPMMKMTTRRKIQRKERASSKEKTYSGSHMKRNETDFVLNLQYHK